MQRFLGQKKLHDIEQIARTNTNYLKVLRTGRHSQIVAMCLPPGEEFGQESHWHSDVTLFVVKGDLHELRKSGDTWRDCREVVFVPKENKCRFKNIGHRNLKLIAVHTPPEYLDGIHHRTKANAAAAEKEGIEHAWEQ